MEIHVLLCTVPHRCKPSRKSSTSLKSKLTTNNRATAKSASYLSEVVAADLGLGLGPFRTAALALIA
jgi:hypothetical protein